MTEFDLIINTILKLLTISNFINSVLVVIFIVLILCIIYLFVLSKKIIEKLEFWNYVYLCICFNFIIVCIDVFDYYLL